MPGWRTRLIDAHRFLEAAEVVHDPEHLNQAASNAVLAMIAANDAACLWSGKPAPRGASHTAAAQALRDACRGTRWESDASERARQVIEVLRLKNAAQYTGERLSAETVSRLLRQAKRFVAWVRQITSDV